MWDQSPSKGTDGRQRCVRVIFEESEERSVVDGRDGRGDVGLDGKDRGRELVEDIGEVQWFRGGLLKSEGRGDGEDDTSGEGALDDEEERLAKGEFERRVADVKRERADVGDGACQQPTKCGDLRVVSKKQAESHTRNITHRHPRHFESIKRNGRGKG